MSQPIGNTLASSASRIRGPSSQAAATLAGHLRHVDEASLSQSQRGLALAALRDAKSESLPAFETAAWFRDALMWAKTHGFSCVCLDATLAGMRPRELDASARREISVLLRRHDLLLAGVDCFVPSEHLLGAQQLRAIDALEHALSLCASLRSVWCSTLPLTPTATQSLHGACVTTMLPSTLDSAAAAHLASSAKRSGVVIADVTSPSAFAHCGEPEGWGAALRPATTAMSTQEASDAFAKLVLSTPLLMQARVPHTMSADQSSLHTYLSLLHVRGWRGAVVSE